MLLCVCCVLRVAGAGACKVHLSKFAYLQASELGTFVFEGRAGLPCIFFTSTWRYGHIWTRCDLYGHI